MFSTPVFPVLPVLLPLLLAVFAGGAALDHRAQRRRLDRDQP